MTRSTRFACLLSFALTVPSRKGDCFSTALRHRSQRDQRRGLVSISQCEDGRERCSGAIRCTWILFKLTHTPPYMARLALWKGMPLPTFSITSPSTATSSTVHPTPPTHQSHPWASTVWSMDLSLVAPTITFPPPHLLTHRLSPPLLDH
eukprot:scaffold122646_cov30-Tisochrysis_lutea.AAC.3